MKYQNWFVPVLLLGGSYSSFVGAQEITVMISGGFSAALDQLAPVYQQKSGDTLRIIHGPSMGQSPEAIPHRLESGQTADVVIMVGYALDKLQQAGKMTPASRIELADSRIGAVVRSGTSVPDISTPGALKKTLLEAKSIAYSDSASGQYVQSELFNKLGIADEVHQKAKMVEKTPVASVVAQGKYEIGFQQVSELLPVKGAKFIGPVPDTLQYVTRFAGAVVAKSSHQQHARQLLCYLASAQAKADVEKTGLDALTSTVADCPA
ncbi:substrate-binding domain-containing protein [Enterobacteriaceae bacterium H11S18]|uniref:substrate-binding domain-containing protein n=1 Tax=Dryocola clanedunensis TaxID=2925396 RepID=UPI0022F08CFE|nr:substrate-binding domain-containing protein [Dryocola clanedunensis]MCT4713345.1 substrate-binding domain-containing protein [Dryocola clanedunensis]